MKRYFKFVTIVILGSLIFGAICSPLCAGEHKNKFSFSLNLNAGPILYPSPVPAPSLTYVETYRPYIQEHEIFRTYYHPCYPQNIVHTNPHIPHPYYREVMVNNPPKIYERVVVNPSPYGY